MYFVRMFVIFDFLGSDIAGSDFEGSDFASRDFIPDWTTKAIQYVKSLCSQYICLPVRVDKF